MPLAIVVQAVQANSPQAAECLPRQSALFKIPHQPLRLGPLRRRLVVLVPISRMLRVQHAISCGKRCACPDGYDKGAERGAEILQRRQTDIASVNKSCNISSNLLLDECFGAFASFKLFFVGEQSPWSERLPGLIHNSLPPRSKRRKAGAKHSDDRSQGRNSICCCSLCSHRRRCCWQH
jgi:hypothetical protein